MPTITQQDFYAFYRLQDAAQLLHTAWTLACLGHTHQAASYRRMAEEQLRAGVAYLDFDLIKKAAADDTLPVTAEVAA